MWAEKLDMTYIRETLSMLERALGQSDLLQALERTLERIPPG